MYKIETQNADTITLTGTSSVTTTLSFLPGYTWFGYTGGEGLSISEALGNGVTPSEGDQIIGQEGSATFSNDEWSGSLTSLVPGKGYVYVSTAQRSKTDTRNTHD